VENNLVARKRRFQTFLEAPIKEGGTGVPPVIVNPDHAQDVLTTLKKRRGAPKYLAGKGWAESSRVLLRKYRVVNQK